MTLAVLILVIAAGFIARALAVRLARSTSDLFIATRPPSEALIGAGISAEHLSGPGIVALILIGAFHGPGGAWLLVAFIGGLVALLSSAAPHIRRAGAYAPGDLAYVRWEDHSFARQMHAIAAAVMALSLAPVLQVAGAVFTDLWQIPNPAAISLAAIGLGAAVMAFRGRGSHYAQPIRLAAMAAGAIAAARLIDAGAAIPGVTIGIPDHHPVWAVSLGLAVAIGTIAAPQLWPRLESSHDGFAARRVIAWAAAIVTLIGIAALGLGDATAGQADTTAASAYPAWRGVALGGLLSACLAGGSAMTIAGSLAVHRVGLHSRPGALLTVLVPGAGLAIAWSSIDVVTVTGWGAALAAAALAPPTFLSIWWRKASVRGLRWGMWTGLALSAAAIVVAWATYDSVSSAGWALVAAPALIATPVALLVSMVGSRGGPNLEERQLALHRP